MQGGNLPRLMIISRYPELMRTSGQCVGAQMEGLELAHRQHTPYPPVFGGKTMGQRVIARNTTAVGARNVPADTLRH